MRRYSKEYILINGKKYHLLSIKEEWGEWSKLGFVQKSKEKDEFGFIPIFENESFLRCPHLSNLPPMNMLWTPLPTYWLGVRQECQKCWGSHSTPQGEFNCILRSFQIKQFKDGEAIGISKPPQNDS